jgi:fused signal recognition particle receptor
VKRFALGSRLRALFGLQCSDDQWFEDLEDTLVEGDIGPAVAQEMIRRLRETPGARPDRDSVLNALRDVAASYLRVAPLELLEGTLNLFLVLGVNGVGKTTTIAKLAHHYGMNRGMQVMLAAADTFRAAAADQLALWGQRLGVPVVRQGPGADPGAVIYDAVSSAQARRADLVLADTAGRMHTKENLVRELAKVDRIARNRIQEGAYKRVLVIDATTGQNALRQAEVFSQAVGVDSIVLAKYDSTAKGGIVLSICRDLKIPFSFMGTGESLEAIEPFDADVFLESLLGQG